MILRRELEGKMLGGIPWPVLPRLSSLISSRISNPEV
jgi:hypothetical protein